MNILVTGASGQLGRCLKTLVDSIEDKAHNVHFKSSFELDITDTSAVLADFTENDYQFCINCAAYTQVDMAESESDKAYTINVQGVDNLIQGCKLSNAILLHLSTDFVFDGNANKPYKETDIPSGEIGVYGSTKRKAESLIMNALERFYIIRTSWLYSEFGHNFMKKMLELAKERKELSVVDDQMGTPTYAKDLARIILKMINSKEQNYGLYHFSNEGQTTWYGFAKEIFNLAKSKIDLRPVPTEAYPTLAQRPKFSVLDTSKIKQTFQLEIPHWKDGLKRAFMAYAEKST